MREADARTESRSVAVVLPENVDDPTLTSGGNVYDRRICTGLAELGWLVTELPVAGDWPLPDPAARERLAAELDRLPDGATVLLDGLVACGVPDILKPRATRLGLTVLVHLPLAEERGRPADIAARLNAAEGAALDAAAAVVAASEWAARRLGALHGLARDRIRVITPGTDPAPPAAGTDGVSRLLCVGSVTPTKGQDLLVEALARVADLPWTCALVGPVRRNPAHVNGVRARIERHRLGDRVRLSGPYSPERLAGEYHTADLVIAPSRVETFGMAAAEAVARGVPVVSAASGGLADTVGPAGILVPPDDVDALAEALRQWLTDAGLRERLRRSAAERRSVFATWSDVTGQLSELLDGVRGRRT